MILFKNKTNKKRLKRTLALIRQYIKLQGNKVTSSSTTPARRMVNVSLTLTTVIVSATILTTRIHQASKAFKLLLLRQHEQEGSIRYSDCSKLLVYGREDVRGVERRSTVKGWDRDIVTCTQMSLGTVSKATLGRRLRDVVECIWTFSSASTPCWTELTKH